MRSSLTCAAVFVTIGSSFGLPIEATAAIQVFHSDEAYLNVAGTVHIINFNEQPNGSPALDGVPISPEFNYGNHGATFAAGMGSLTLASNLELGFVLRAEAALQINTWIDANLTTPATAVAILHGDATTLSVFDVYGTLLGIAEPDKQGLVVPRHDEAGFLGIVSDVPVGSIRVSRGAEHEEIAAFFFTPVPEPATALLLSTVVVMLRSGPPRR